MKVRNGDKVKVDYKGMLEDGAVFDSSEGREPLGFRVGAGEVIKGLDKSVVGMEEGEKRRIRVPPEEAYGPRREDLVGKIRSEQVAGVDVRPGSVLPVRTPEGKAVDATVVEVSEDGVIVDLNHRLAGRTLNFEIKLVVLEREERGPAG